MAEMLKHDLGAARNDWLNRTTSSKERRQRQGTDFLAFEDRSGRFADFHALRHTFIDRLRRSGVHPKTAQALARHSDINLTMNIYSHVLMSDQHAAVDSLPPLEEPDDTQKGPARR